MPPRTSQRARSNNPDDQETQTSGTPVIIEHTFIPPEPEQMPRQESTQVQEQLISPLITPAPEIKDERPAERATSVDLTPNLAQAIMLMTEELQCRGNPSRKTKSKEPDTFDGSDPRKLNNFILLCNLYFRNNPAYSEDESKVTFALSYLRGTALEYFEPSILDSDDIPIWMDNWSAFIRTLRTQFGPIDPTADAEDGIDHLKMNDNQRIVKYNVEFNRLAIRTGWDDSVPQVATTLIIKNDRVMIL
jgi:hypothetical protein